MNKQLGYFGENLASDFLMNQGYSVLEKNYVIRGSEIDLIAEKNGRLHFIEVKTRRTKRFGETLESITPQKIQKLERGILSYLEENGRSDEDFQLDLITVEQDMKKQWQCQIFENIAA